MSLRFSRVSASDNCDTDSTRNFNGPACGSISWMKSASAGLSSTMRIRSLSLIFRSIRRQFDDGQLPDNP
jgi:hypothetical protein